MNGTLILATLEEAAEKFGGQSRSGGAWAVVLVVLLLLALAALGAFIVMKLLRLGRRPHSGRALFEELADAHGLTPAERTLLLNLAHRERLSDPSRLFVERPHLETWSKSGADPSLPPLFEHLFDRK